MNKDNRFLEVFTGIVKRDFDGTSDFYKERYKDIYNQMLVYNNLDCSNNLKKYKHGPFQYVDFYESLYLTSLFLGSIDKKFEEKFCEDLKNRNILINDEIYAGVFDYENNKIYVNKTSTIVDCFSLVHEYIHKLSANLDEKDSISDNCFAHSVF